MFRLDLPKTIQVISALLDFHGYDEMDYMRMLKLLYIADRESIRETGYPITGDEVVAMRYGPVLDGIYAFMKDAKHSDEWSKHFVKDGYQIHRIAKAGDGELSEYVLDKLKELTAKYADMDAFDMAVVTHGFPEWKDPGSSCYPITPEAIYEAVGQSQDYPAIRREIEAINAFDDSLARNGR